MMAQPHGIILTSLTAEENVRLWYRTPEPKIRITDNTARTIASWYQSSSELDQHTTRLSHGMWFDTAELIVECERNQRLVGDTAALRALIHWAKTF